jgi:hypothetical protein
MFSFIFSHEKLNKLTGLPASLLKRVIGLRFHHLLPKYNMFRSNVKVLGRCANLSRSAQWSAGLGEELASSQPLLTGKPTRPRVLHLFSTTPRRMRVGHPAGR